MIDYNVINICIYLINIDVINILKYIYIYIYTCNESIAMEIYLFRFVMTTLIPHENCLSILFFTLNTFP